MQLLERLRVDELYRDLEQAHRDRIRAEVEPMLNSRALQISERICSLRGGEPAISRARLRRMLDS